MRLGAVRLFVNDMQAAMRFYGGALGLPLVHDGSAHGYCVFDGGSLQLVVEAVADDATDEDRSLVGRFTGLSFDVADIRTEHARLCAAGVDFTGGPELQPWGGWLATLRDPSGNGLQLAQRPA